jgi:ATP-binding cassette subfamily C protein
MPDARRPNGQSGSADLVGHFKTANDAVLSAALASMANVVEPGKYPQEARPDQAHDRDHDLLAACRLIGTAQGFHIPDIPPTGADGNDLAERLRSICDIAGLGLRQVALRGEWWREDHGPLLAFLADQAPVALLPLPPGHYTLKDPHHGQEWRINAARASELQFFGYSFYRPLPVGPNGLGTLGRFGLTRDNLKDLRQALVIGVIGGLIGLIPPAIGLLLFDHVIPGADKKQLWQIGLALLLTALSSAIFHMTRVSAFLRIDGRTALAIQAAVILRLCRLPLSFFRQYSVGDLYDRAESISSILRALSTVAIDSILAAIFSTLNLLLLLGLSLKLTLFALLATGFYLVFSLTIYLFLLGHTRDYVAQQGRLSGLMLEILQGMAKIRSCGAEIRFFQRWAEAFSRQRRAAYRASRLAALLESGSSLFPVLVSTGLFALVAFAAPGTISTGSFIAFSSALGIFQTALINMLLTLVGIAEIIPVYERVGPILTATPEIASSPRQRLTLSGRIVLDRLSFRYQPTGPLILNQISFDLKPGQMVALVGPSGSGKSTLLRLLLGFEQAESGRLLYDDLDISALDLRHFRRQLGVVLQDGQLIPGSILQNILGLAGQGIEEAWEAARLAGIAADIEAMPMQMHTLVSEGSTNISTGQRQRLLIARALLRRPKILFFDEATSALDNTTQAQIMANIGQLKATRVVIAHRLSTIVSADQIHFIDQGRLVESGTYQELIHSHGLFTQFAQRQL